MKFSSLLPEEIRNAKLANEDLTRTASISSNHFAFLIFNLITILAGGAVGFLFREAIDQDILETIITFSGVIIGFVITAMLFSGRSAFAVGLNLQQVKIYRIKTKYMLLSQANTLFSFLFCLAFCMATLFAIKLNAQETSHILLATAFAYLFLGGYRTLLLPYQIYEVHCFSLDNLVEETAETERAAFNQDSSERMRNFESGSKQN